MNVDLLPYDFDNGDMENSCPCAASNHLKFKKMYLMGYVLVQLGLPYFSTDVIGTR